LFLASVGFLLAVLSADQTRPEIKARVVKTLSGRHLLGGDSRLGSPVARIFWIPFMGRQARGSPGFLDVGALGAGWVSCRV